MADNEVKEAASACDCLHCRHHHSDDRLSDAKENDRLIGWPADLDLHDDESTEFPLRLKGFSNARRDEILLMRGRSTYALLTLVKNGICLADLTNGYAHRAREEKKEGKVADEPDATMTLLRVGRNFVDYEVPRHDTLPAHLYSSVGEVAYPGGKWPECRVREMMDSKDDCVYRVFVADHPNPYKEGGDWYAVKEAISEIESSIHKSRKYRRMRE